MKKHKFIEFLVDPSSGDLSASRFILCVLLLVYFPVMASLEAIGIHFSFWAQFALIVGSVAGIYLGNSAVRVWRGRVVEGGGPPKPGA